MKILNLYAIIAFGAMAMTSCKNEDALTKINAENISSAAKRDAATNKFPVMEFDKTVHDFGTLKQGDRVETVFKFKNTGDKPLVIVGIKGSCGCTVPNDWPRQAIVPGEEGQFSVKFNSSNKKNQVNLTITIDANTETGKEQVQIKAIVEVPDAANISVKNPTK